MRALPPRDNRFVISMIENPYLQKRGILDRLNRITTLKSYLCLQINHIYACKNHNPEREKETMCTPRTSYPRRFNSRAKTALSTPPDTAQTTRRIVLDDDMIVVVSLNYYLPTKMQKITFLKSAYWHYFYLHRNFNKNVFEFAHM